MSREKMLSWLDRVKSRKIPNEASANKNHGTLERILDENRRGGKSVSFTQEDVEFEIFHGGKHRHEFVDVELTGELNDPEDGPKLRKRFVIAVEEKLDGEFTGQLTKVKPAETLPADQARIKHRSSPARAKLSSCKRALKKFLNSPGKSRLFLSPSKNKKTRLVNEEATEPKISDLRNSRDSGWEEMTSLCSSLSSLTIEEDAADFWASSPLCRGKEGSSSSASSSSAEQNSPTSAKDKIVKNTSRVPSQRSVRAMLKFANADSVSYRRLAEPSKKSFSWTDVEASADSSRQRDKCLRRKSDSDVLLKAVRRFTESTEYSLENYASGNLAPSRLKRGDSLEEFLLGDVGDAKFGQISTIFPDGSVDDEAEDCRSSDEEFSSSKKRGDRRISAVSTSSTSDFSVDSLEDPSGKKLTPISRLDESPMDCLGRVREYRQRISHSNSAPELFEKELSFGCEDEIEHFASLDNLSSVLSRREGEENSLMAPVEELRDFGDDEETFSRSYSCLEDDYTINMNNSSYIITMYV